MTNTRNAVSADAATDRFEALFRAHHAAVVAYVRRRMADDAVDDVVGETFLVAWRRLDRVPDEELPWLIGVARNVLATQHRGALRRRALALRIGGTTAATAASSGDAPAASMTVDALDGELSKALATLSPKDREALTLIAWDGLSPHEAALAMEASPGAFRVRLHRARQRLRALLDGPSEPAHPAASHRLRLEETAHD